MCVNITIRHRAILHTPLLCNYAVRALKTPVITITIIYIIIIIIITTIKQRNSRHYQTTKWSDNVRTKNRRVKPFLVTAAFKTSPKKGRSQVKVLRFTPASFFFLFCFTNLKTKIKTTLADATCTTFRIQRLTASWNMKCKSFVKFITLPNTFVLLLQYYSYY